MSILDSVRVRMSQVLDMVRESGVAFTYREMFHGSRECVEMVRDLSTFEPPRQAENGSGFTLAEVRPETFEQIRPVYLLQSRLFKAGMYVGRGYNSFVLLSDNIVVGDLWWVPFKEPPPPVHPDLEFLGFELCRNDVYMFDMYLARDRRGQATSARLLGGALQSLKEQGFQNAYCYVVAEKTPAVWMHRMLGFRSLRKFGLTRILSFQKASK